MAVMELAALDLSQLRWEEAAAVLLLRETADEQTEQTRLYLQPDQAHAWAWGQDEWRHLMSMSRADGELVWNCLVGWSSRAEGLLIISGSASAWVSPQVGCETQARYLQLRLESGPS